MTGSERQMPDSELDRLLSIWLSEGTEAAPDRIAEAAIREVTTVGQERAWLAAIQASFSSAPLAWAAAVFALAVGIGVVIGPSFVTVEPSPTPEPSSSPSPSESPVAVPPGMVLFTNETDGYELLIRSEWEPRELLRFGEPCPGVTAFGFAPDLNYPAVTVSVGDTNGVVAVSSTGGCHDVTATTLDELAEAIDVTPMARASGSEVTEDLTLGGEPARYEAFLSGLAYPFFPAFHHVFAFHEGRPIVIAFDHWTFRTSLTFPLSITFNERLLIESFRFLDAPEPPSGMVLYSNPADGYELLVPETWDVGVEPDFGEPFPGVVRFGTALRGEFGALTISVGTADGSVYICEGGLCHLKVVRSLDELREAVVSVPASIAAQYEIHGQTELGGEAAEIETMRRNGIVGGPPLFYSVYALHGSRPIVLTFDHYLIRFGRLSSELIHQMLGSLRFLDRPRPSPVVSQTGLVLYSNHEGGYEVLLPESWRDSATPISYRGGEPFPGVQKFGLAGNNDGYQALTISIGQPVGTVFAGCQAGYCRRLTARTLDELQEVLVSTPSFLPDSWRDRRGARRGDLTLGGEPGRFEEAGIPRNQGHSVPWAMYHVFTIHNGRPVVLAFDLWNLRFNRLGTNTAEQFAEMVASFRFAD